MDAKPFRPSRQLVPFNGADSKENIGGPKQVVHSRHKSTGNLLHQRAAGSMQGVVKRTAFGERSNTNQPPITHIDGYKMPAKSVGASSIPVARDQENNAHAIHVPKDAAFLRPAQRPSSKGGASILPSATAGHIQPLSHLPAQGLTKPAQQKRATTVIYNDSRPSTAGAGAPPNSRASTTTADLASRQPRHHQSQPALNQRHQTATASQKVSIIDNPGPWENRRAEEDVTEGLYLDAVEELPHEDQFPVLEPERPAVPASLPVTFEPELIGVPETDNRVVEFQDNNNSQANPEEPVELSDYEDDEAYDEAGYTTAHSYKSRGDNITLGITTTMWPPDPSKKDYAELEQAKNIVESKRTDEEMEEEAWDISMVAEYGDDIFNYMRELEMSLLPNAHYMDIQTEIQWSMRGVLMDWVIQVHARFNLLPETLFLTVNYIDRFLSNKIVSLGKLQLVGATAIFVAAKYEEINCPSVGEVVYMVDGGYSVEEILKAERFMLSMLNFELGWPGPMSFLRRISKADDYDLETRTLAKYFLEVAVMDERFVATPASYIAAGAHCLSRLILVKGDWTPDHVHYSGYTYTQLKPLIGLILDCCRMARKHHGAVFDKYSDKRYKRASIYVETELKKGFMLPFQQALPSPVSFDDELPAQAQNGFGATHAGWKMPIPMQG